MLRCGAGVPAGILIRALVAAAILLPATFATVVRAEEPAESTAATKAQALAARSRVTAATRDAVANLLEEIGRTPLSGNITVRDLLARTSSFDDLAKTLQGAEQIGGPRWVDDRTCQVELQISGPRIGIALRRIVAANPGASPISLAELNLALTQWKDRSFSAIGVAVAHGPLMTTVTTTTTTTTPVIVPDTGVGAAKPRPAVRSERWAKVSDADRDLAFSAAKLDAAQRSLRSVSPVSLTARLTVGDILSAGDVGQNMELWFISQPVSTVDFRDDLQAEVVLTVSPNEAFDTFRGFALKQKEVVLPPAADKGWDRVKDEFKDKMSIPVGRGSIPDDPIGFAPRRRMGLRGTRDVNPVDVPAWVGKRMDAEAVGMAARGRLMAARAAEASAEKKLRVQIEALAWAGGKTLGDAAEKNPRIANAISKALHMARIAKTEYREDGSAKVELYLDLDQLWVELRGLE